MLYCMHMQAPTTCMAPSRHLSVCRHAQVDRQSPSLIQAPDWPQRNPASYLAVDGLGLSARTPHVYLCLSPLLPHSRAYTADTPCTRNAYTAHNRKHRHKQHTPGTSSRCIYPTHLPFQPGERVIMLDLHPLLDHRPLRVCLLYTSDAADE